ncbi:hypothetical protein PFICI_10816 [Pestalotiopsis fici W106-1]|uniref:BZIP domain-containing protein n=1 Tax=Pestalotiopsis fici (strain W106-1 / CGMCC3.15140) TaxID=1229662 RepID=W3WUX5_PESFW|nr:uncharacterized protein PFICI_10816 [Pestalotiopsis fici W106-1]ETS76942.1 hypothetical protein PFICI_10816 [Pestalotiopsis fici W106-1]
MDAEQELKRRRERGRSAQAAFRKRQALAVQEMQQENKRLREALESVVKIARHDDRRDLVSVIRQGAEAAGIDVEHLPAPGSEYVLQPNDNLGSCGARGQSETSASNVSLSSEPSRPEVDTSKEADLAVTRASQPAFKATRCMMWLNPMRYMRLDKPPEDIVPYIGDAANTLAGHLFWAVMEHARSDCHHEHHALSRQELSTSQNPCIQRMMRHSIAMQSISHGLIKAMVEARLEYRHLGYISAEYAGAADPDTVRSLRRSVAAEFGSRGQDESVWVDAIGVESRVRSLLGPDYFATLERAARSPESAKAHISLSWALDRLIGSFICFGDGPRWNVLEVDDIFSSWLSHVEC